MFRMLLLLLCSATAVLGIIVTDPPPSETDYRYSYDIEDPTTGDRKSQHEVRLGDMVSGAYSVVGPDGTKRIVEYTADSKHGFKAVVREEPVNQPISEPQPTQELPYHDKLQAQNPGLYTLVEAKIPDSYVKDSHNIVLFTPANEIRSDKLILEHGKYFEPTA